MTKDKSFVAIMGSSLIAALLAGSCCLAPLLFLIFGVSVSSLSFLQFFAPYKWIFSSIALMTMIYLWYMFLTKETFTCSSKVCKNYKLYLILGTFFVSIFVSYPYWANYILEYL